MHKEGLPKQSLFVSATNETMKSLVGYLSVDKGQHGSYLPIQLEPDTVIYFYPW